MITKWRSLLPLLIACALAMPAPTGVLAKSKIRSAADQRLYDKAKAACREPYYPSGTRFIINYSGKWFRCVEPKKHRN